MIKFQTTRDNVGFKRAVSFVGSPAEVVMIEPALLVVQVQVRLKDSSSIYDLLLVLLA